MSQFFINLMKKEVLSKELMTKFILSLLKNILEKIKEKEKQKICEEICENLFILLNKNLLYFENDEIIKILKNITNMKKETTPSLTNKIKFKIMDILES